MAKNDSGKQTMIKVNNDVINNKTAQERCIRMRYYHRHNGSFSKVVRAPTRNLASY